MAMRVENFVRYVRLSLGQDRDHGVSVELTDAQIVLALREAISFYSRYFPLRSHQYFSAPIGIYQFDTSPRVRGILELSMAPAISLGVSIPELTHVGGRVISLTGGIDYTIPFQYATFVEWKNAAEKVFSQVPSWVFVPESGKIYTCCPSRGYHVSFVGALDFEDGFEDELMWDEPDVGDELPSEKLANGKLDNTLNIIPSANMLWIRKLTLAKSKTILGRMLRKYSGVPGVEGGTIQLDGEALVSEGKEEWDSTAAEIMDSVPDVPPIFF